MMDRGDILTILPGTISNAFVATRNVILATINAGTSSEIGIILGGTWEQSIANQISGGQPYYYCSEDEAKAKLIDPTIDYSEPIKNNQVESMRLELKEFEDKISELRKIIQDKDDVIKDLNEKLQESNDNKFDKIKLNEAIKQLSDYEVQVKKLTSELEGEKSNSNNLKETIDKLNLEKSSLNNRLEVTSIELNNSKLKVKELEDSLSQESDNSQHTLDQLSTVKLELDKTKKALSDLVDKTEEMKKTFNGVCEKFNIQYTESGEWIQV
jgi:chromosome segregation ATPase